jgi:aminopeptidase N
MKIMSVCNAFFNNFYDNFLKDTLNQNFKDTFISDQFLGCNHIHNHNPSSLTSYFPDGSNFQYSPDIQAKTKHLFLDLKTDILDAKVQATAILTLEILQPNLQTLVLDAVNMQINNVFIDQKPTNFIYDGQNLTINLKSEDQRKLNLKKGKKIQLKINYQLDSPQKGLIFNFPTQDYPNTPVQVWSQGESQENRYWFPCFDYPKQICTTEVRVQVPTGFTAVSNGILFSHTKDTHTETFHYKQDLPHPTYLIALTIGKYHKIELNHNGLNIQYYTRLEKKKELALTASKTPAMIDFLENFFQTKYPWQKYAQVWVYNFEHGGMENTTCTFNIERSLLDEISIKENDYTPTLILHELAHQWFGDLVVIDFWENLWIKEGMATFAEIAWIRFEKGDQEADYFLYKDQQSYFESVFFRPTSSNFFRDTDDFYDDHSYAKASCIYHSLKAYVEQKTGDTTLFSTALKVFISENKHQNVDGKKLLQAFEKTTGLNLKPILDQYIYRAGHPKLKCTWSWDEGLKQIKINIDQTQAKDNKDVENLFILKDFPVFFNYLEKNKPAQAQELLTINQKNQNFYFILPSKPTHIDFDPKSVYLKEIELNLTIKELSSQLQKSQYIASQLQAIKSLAKNVSVDSFKALVTKLEPVDNQEPHWGICVEIIKVLDNFADSLSQPVLIKMAQFQNSKIRASALTTLSKVNSQTTFNFLLEALPKQIDSYLAKSACLTSLGAVANNLSLFDSQNPAIAQAEQIFTPILDDKHQSNENQLSWNALIELSALKGLANLTKSEIAVQQVIAFCKAGVEPNLRAGAINLLGLVAKNRTDAQIGAILDTLQNLLKEDGYFIEVSCVSALGAISSQRSVNLLQKIVDKTPNKRIKVLAERTRDKLISTLKPNKNYQELNTQIQKIQKENLELKTKLEKLSNDFDSLLQKGKKQM